MLKFNLNFLRLKQMKIYKNQVVYYMQLILNIFLMSYLYLNEEGSKGEV